MNKQIKFLEEKFDTKITCSESIMDNNIYFGKNGNIIQLRLEKLNIQDLKVLFPFVDSLEKLSLVDCNIQKLNGLEKFKKLKHLDLKINPFSSLEGIEKLEELETLNLACCTNILSLDKLQFLKKLKNLNLSCLDNLDFAKQIQILKKLKIEELILDDNEFENLDIIPCKENLTFLSVSNCEITNFDISKFRNLKHLELSENPISTIGKLQGGEKLEKLNLRDCDLKDIQNLENLKSLKILELRGNKISKIKGLEKLVHLRELNLSENEIKELNGLENLNKLELLLLMDNNICYSEETLNILTNLSKQCHIYLSLNPITDEIKTISKDIVIDIDTFPSPPLVIL